MIATNPPVLKYNGSKHRIAGWVNSHIPKTKSFVDVFGGSAAIILNREPSLHEYYNDLDGEVVNFFDVIRTQTKDFIRAIRYTPYSIEVFRRAATEQPRNNFQRAYNFYLRNWLGRRHNDRTGSTWRATGNMNTNGHHVPARLFDRTNHLIKVAKRLKNVHFDCTTWQEMVRRYNYPGVMFYLDPPYLMGERKSERLYTHDMKSIWEHFVFLRTVKRLKLVCAISHYRHPLYDRLLSGWTRHDKTTLDQAKNIKVECLYVSPQAEALNQPGLFG